MQYLPIKKLSVVAIMSVAFSSFTYSADIVRELRVNADENSAPENFFELGVGASARVGSSMTDSDGKESGFSIPMSGSYNWNGFFIDFFGETSEPLVIGYNAYNYTNWSFDVVLGATGNGISKDYDKGGRFEGINKREGGLFLGGRATGYYGDNIIQLSLKHDVSGKSQGSIASALLGRNWQYRNWNFHGLVGISLTDAKLADYLLGVSEEEASRTNFTIYHGKASLNINSSIGVTYPINENWIYRATLRAGSGIGQNDSPLFAKRRNFYTAVNTSISYVF